MKIRLCDPCRTGYGAYGPGNAYYTAAELCASRLTLCRNHPSRLAAHVKQTAYLRKKGSENG